MGTKIQLILTVFALMLCSALVRADEPAAADHVLVPDDIVEIIVRNHSELNRTASVSPAGTIAFPEIGEVKASGLTARKLASTLQTKLEETLNDVLVTVTLKETHPAKLTVAVVGTLKSTGVLEIKPSWRLIDLIASAGGLTVKSSLVHGRIMRGTNVIVLDVPEALAHPERDANVPLMAGDLLLLDEKEVFHPQITVVGQVDKPGAFDLNDTTSLSSILTETGGPNAKAALSKAYVLRKGKRIPVDLRAAAAGQSASPGAADFKFQPSDILFVPENTEKYSVLGEAHSTGSFTYPTTGKITVLEVYTQVGGRTGQGDIANAGIIRFTNGNYSVSPVNIARLLEKKSKAVNPPLEPGDTLYIPSTKAHGFSWNSVIGPLSALGLLGLRL